MAWKCPHCEKELEEKDAIRSNCPYCFRLFDRPAEFQKEESRPPAEEPRRRFSITGLNTESGLFWLSVTALGFLLVSFLLEVRQTSKKDRPTSPRPNAVKTASKQEHPSKTEEGNAEEKAIRASEQEVAETVLTEYGRKTCQKINEALKIERVQEQKDEEKLGNLLGNPVGLAHTQLQSVYTNYGQAYLLLLGTGNNLCTPKVLTNEIVITDTGLARERLVIRPVASPSLNPESLRLFNAVHSEPYEFLVYYVHSGNRWKLSEWRMVGTEWNFRPLTR